MNKINTILYNLYKTKSINVIGNMPNVEPLPISTKNLSWFKRHINIFSARKWKLTKNYVLKINDIYLFCPNGFECDFASIPRIFWNILAPTGPLLIGSVFHDFGYRFSGMIIMKNNNFEFVKLTKNEIDEIFYEITKKVNELTAFAYIAKKAVNWFGFLAWNSNRKENNDIYKTYPYLKKEIKG